MASVLKVEALKGNRPFETTRVADGFHKKGSGTICMTHSRLNDAIVFVEMGPSDIRAATFHPRREHEENIR
jgi:hypothetical protein